MLRSLSEDWNSLRMLIENTKDVNSYSLDELYRTLMTYELNNTETKEKTRRSKEEMNEPSKRQIALKSTNDEGSSNTNMSDEELDDLVLVKKWGGFRNNQRFQKKDDKGEEKNKKIICYDCDKPGHKRTECPNKKKFNKNKALQTTWDDSDEDDLEEDEVPSTCD
ncbi:CCHC-type domain-containing protein [Abeliophyllum distichum]|uniref:CCHC-type domain-containing protein n=1 Tax=Abeliophyllum distichum TaxID=126358 RepID=A0ABD1QXP3_9LAMI